MLFGALLCERLGLFAGVAQLVEQLTCNQQVGGSSPLAGSRNIKGLWDFPQTLFVPLPW